MNGSDHSSSRRALASVLCLWLAASAGALAQTPAARPAQPRTPPPSTATKPPAQKVPPAPAPAARPRAERAVPFAVGETLTYDVAWANYVTAGYATLAVREKKPSYGSVAYYITAEGQPVSLLQKLYSLYYKADTLLDAYTLLPQRSSVYSNENGRERMKTTLIDQAKHAAKYEVRTATVVNRTLTVPAYTQDLLSAVYVMRSIQLNAGAKMTIPVTDSGKVIKVQVTVGQRETIRTPAGTVPAWRVEPRVLGADATSAGAQSLALWISDDARRLPVKLAAEVAVGTFTFTLREATGTK
jgi:hypothetical protein